MHHRLIACPDCDLLYASPAPEASTLANEYKNAAYDSDEEARFAAKTYARVISEVVELLPDRVGALDIGAGDGAFLHELLVLGFTAIVGVEPSQAPIAAATPEVRPLLKLVTFDAANFQAASFSLVTSFQTLEHVPDPKEVVTGSFRLLKVGGAAVFVCHNRRSFSARLFGLKSPIYDIEHLQLFSPESARSLLNKAGFSDIEARPIWNRYPLHYWLRLLPLPSSFKAGFISLSKSLGFGYCPVSLPAGNLAVSGFKRRTC